MKHDDRCRAGCPGVVGVVRQVQPRLARSDRPRTIVSRCGCRCHRPEAGAGKTLSIGTRVEFRGEEGVIVGYEKWGAKVVMDEDGGERRRVRVFRTKVLEVVK